ncbi:hypothetical protein [Amycolatopsis sp. NPDC050768]|uniref:hypothetical protein n=1 Tax=Amycolatopsis sp. NPDC050768 TaxID=3154839 RepID=UPI00340C3C87
MAGHWYWYVVLALVVGGYGLWYLLGYRRRTATFAAGAGERGWTYRAPALTVRRRGVAGVVAGRLGVGGSATGNPDFDRRFVFEGDATVLTPEAQTWLTAHPRPFRIDGGEVLVWNEGRFDLDRVEPALEQFGELISHTRLG